MRFASILLLGGASLARALSCNGRAELCDRKYSNITMVGTHDSAFVGILPTDNQLKSVKEQLAQGVRYLQACGIYDNIFSDIGQCKAADEAPHGRIEPAFATG